MASKLTVTLEIDSINPITMHNLQSWFDQRKLEKLGVKRLRVLKVVENHGWTAQRDFDEEDRE